MSAVIRNSNPPARPRARRRGTQGQPGWDGWGQLSGHKPRGTHKSRQFPAARSSNGRQVRGPPAARQLDAIKRWPLEVSKVGSVVPCTLEAI